MALEPISQAVRVVGIGGNQPFGRDEIIDDKPTVSGLWGVIVRPNAKGVLAPSCSARAVAMAASLMVERESRTLALPFPDRY